MQAGLGLASPSICGSQQPEVADPKGKDRDIFTGDGGGCTGAIVGPEMVKAPNA